MAERELDEPAGDDSPADPPWRIFLVFLRLGLTSFGGPVAHLGYFRSELVERRHWIDEHGYADLIALCQLLPGPASSQTGFALGLMRGGMPGGLAAWLGFTLPSALAMACLGVGIGAYGNVIDPHLLHGLKIVAVAVVAQAVWAMGRSLAPDPPRMTFAVVATVLATAWPGALAQIGAILLGGIAGWRLLAAKPGVVVDTLRLPIARRAGSLALFIFLLLLLALPLLARLEPSHALALVDRFYRAGALVFGGGHVVLPLLQSAVVPPGWIGNDEFLAGYGAAQALPGPLFTFAAYLGAVMRPAPNGWLGAAICLLAIYLPSFLLVSGALPFWDYARRHAGMRAALLGVNAAVVGLLLAALYNPVWTSAIHEPSDFALALAAFLLLAFWRVPPWLTVILTAAGAILIGA
jgi:chromate transporter